jgi:hypothetical protein
MLTPRGLVGLCVFACAFVLASAASAEPALHSPMTPAVVARLKGVLAASGGARDAFVKIGDSNTANPLFSNCLAGKDVELGERAALETTRAFFSARKVDARRTSFDRASEAATAGWLAGQALAGEPSPLVREVAAVKPAFAVIMLGTNDDRPIGLDAFARNLTEVVDRALALGVVPLMSTLPPRDDAPGAARRIPEMNRTIRAIAEIRQVPLMDLNAALLPLPRHGLVSDGIHLSTVWEGAMPRPCRLTGEGLQKGMNVRNLLVLTALDRARRFLLQDEAPEAEPAPGT